MEAPDSCYQPGQSLDGLDDPRTFPNVGFAIATVPNPVSTHLPLLFDRIVESIQQSAQDEAYAYDDSWFPWEPVAKDYAYLQDQQLAEELQKIQREMPGVMVFRQGLDKSKDLPAYESGLIVFLVGEQPTGGIDDDQFDNALAWIARLGGFSSEKPLRILGPTFSGSLPSLRRILEEAYKTGSLKGYAGPVQVSSGTVSSGLGYERFDDWIKKAHAGSWFRTAMENDSLMTDRFCQYLDEQGYPLDRVAFLSEDETAFGSPQSKQGNSTCKAVDLFYPRDIATLRSAYQQQSIFGSAKPETSSGAPSMTLRGDLSEPSGGQHDTVRSYAGQLTPLAQESVLLDIALRLGEKHVQFIILRSTNSLDQIFLTEFLRRSYPEGRVVIDGADLLFNRGAEGRSLRGVMLLSTYPLLIREQDWTPSLVIDRTRSYRTFGEDTSEGVYIAARELFRNPVPPVPIHDYGAPRWATDASDSYSRKLESAKPATWLSVIGRRQFWPLAVLNSNTMTVPKNSRANSLPRVLDELSSDDAEAAPPEPPTIIWMFAIGCALWSGIHWYLCRNGSIVSSTRALAYFAPMPQWQHPALIALGSLLPAMLALVLASTLVPLFLSMGADLRHAVDGIVLAISVLSTLTLSILACRGNYAIAPLDASAPNKPPMNAWKCRAEWTALIFLAVFAAVHIFLVIRLTPANRIPTYWRSVNLLSGVSPFLPQILFIAGGYLWFWSTLRGLAHFGHDRPRLPTEKDLPTLPDGRSWMPMFSLETAGDLVEGAAYPLTRPYLVWMAACFVIGGIISSVALRGPWVRTLGERSFGMLIYVYVTACIAVILADGIEMWRAWIELRKLLVNLDRLPLRRTLCALKGLAWGSIWKLSGNVLEERYRVISRQFESLTHLANTVREWRPCCHTEAGNRSEVLSGVATCEEKRRDFVNWYVSLPNQVHNLTALRDLQESLASTAGLVMRHVLMPAWQKEKESLILDRFHSEGKGIDGEEIEKTDLAKKLPPHVQVAEEFFVLPYLAFIQNVLGRLRTLGLGALCLFVCATFAVSSYPFEPLNVLSGIFLTVFVLVGGLTILVYAQMSRDATLSYVTNTRPGELGTEFWIRLVTFGVGPLIGLLTTLFPSITDFVFSWLQPSVQALK